LTELAASSIQPGVSFSRCLPPDSKMGSPNKQFRQGVKLASTAKTQVMSQPCFKKSLATPARTDDPPSAQVSLSAVNAATIALQRRETLRRFESLLKKHPAYKAARMVGSAVTTIWRWQKIYAKRGLAGLRPKYKRCGRRSPFDLIRLTAQAVRELEQIHVEHSPRQAWRIFANSVNCPPLVALCIRRTGKPPALLSGVGRLSPVAARCYASRDGKRLYVRLAARATLTTDLGVPGKFKLLGRVE
jgi:hypothetical protein